MLYPKIMLATRTPGGSQVELWRFRGQHFQAFTYTDGVVQLKTCDKEGRNVGILVLNGFNTDDRNDAIKWLNDNIK